MKIISVVAIVSLFLASCGITSQKKMQLEPFGNAVLEDDSWVIESVAFAQTHKDVYLSVSDSNGAPDRESLERLNLLNSNWKEAFRLLESEAFEFFYEPYADAVATVPKFDNGMGLFGTEQIKAVFIESGTAFEVTLRFNWQEEMDDHSVTFYFEDGKCVSHSVDG